MALSMGALAGIMGGVSAGSSLLNTGLGFVSQGWNQRFNAREAKKAREFNASEAEKARAFSAEQAAISREFEERMSNTAYQRAVSDMQKAGYNPASLSMSGASTPSAPSAQALMASSSAASSGVYTRGSFDLSSALNSAIMASIAKDNAFANNVKSAAYASAIQDKLAASNARAAYKSEMAELAEELKKDMEFL